MRDEFLWSEKYRPRTIGDTILPSDLKATFSKFVADGSVPNLLLTGRAGVGKTTVARAMLEQLGADYIVINGSLNGNIDTLRNDIQNFASSVSFSGGRKYVILDEADYLNANSTQPALRNFMEEFAKNCGFIFTCNYPNRIIKELHSRCSKIEFKIPAKEKPKLAAAFCKRALDICAKEGVPVEGSAVAELIMCHFPDWRRTLNEMQRYAATGKIDIGILSNLMSDNFDQLIDRMKAKDYTNVRKWVAENVDIEYTQLFRMFFDKASALVTPASVPQLVLILGEYQYKAAFATDHEINNAACLAELMVSMEWKQ